ncbi:YdeI family protein [Conexibacter sp. DBS9H8]|uniref:YdeI/OmpD-associated family protein n=1 Tax=Conexibacter sp. DBS9H8 TaxID=2937801 RepID=UPI00200DB8A3|nr:YdeI/OmpD-associated family protein [Conexibacter sp. DBS9H8]
MASERQTPRPSGEIVQFATADAFADWLELHHATHPGIWLTLAKKKAEAVTLTYAEALDVALCFGWIDGQKARLDEQHWRQRFTRRSPRSRWSQINREKAEALIAADRMRPAGHAEVERARADGRWDAAYAGQRTATVPEDLQRELDRDPQAAAAFDALDGANRYAIIYRVNDAKRPETRARRIGTFLEMLRRGERIHN